VGQAGQLSEEVVGIWQVRAGEWLTGNVQAARGMQGSRCATAIRGPGGTPVNRSPVKQLIPIYELT
jgi:hypothetical protein